MSDMPWRVLHKASASIVRRRLDLEVEGLENVPAHGPVLIASRHVHHLYDGCALLATLPRPAHIIVALDWVTSPAGRVFMDRACRAAAWPVVARTSGPTGVAVQDAASAFRQAARETLGLWRDGRIVLVFPEGYPNFDPGYTPKHDETEFLPFQRGYAQLVMMAARQGMRVPIVPVGFSYWRGSHWHAHMRFGAPVYMDELCQWEHVASQVETRVHSLSVWHDHRDETGCAY